MHRISHHIIFCLFIAVILGGLAAHLAYGEKICGSIADREDEVPMFICRTAVSTFIPVQEENMELTSAVSTFIPVQEENMELTSTVMIFTGMPQNAQRTPDIQGIWQHLSAVSGTKNPSNRHCPDISDSCPRMADYFVFALGRILV